MEKRIVADMSSYDPEFGDWEFGKLSALREIAFALEEGYKYYYMGMPCLAIVLRTITNVWIGYYIHTCQKMRYKALYRPQYILGKH
jgi:arginyl-tRNA---protein transferase